jgi:hypothetical protein
MRCLLTVNTPALGIVAMTGIMLMRERWMTELRFEDLRYKMYSII